MGHRRALCWSIQVPHLRRYPRDLLWLLPILESCCPWLKKKKRSEGSPGENWSQGKMLTEPTWLTLARASCIQTLEIQGKRVNDELLDLTPAKDAVPTMDVIYPKWSFPVKTLVWRYRLPSLSFFYHAPDLQQHTLCRKAEPTSCCRYIVKCNKNKQ